jgi:hypothetical protein
VHLADHAPCPCGSEDAAGRCCLRTFPVRKRDGRLVHERTTIVVPQADLRPPSPTTGKIVSGCYAAWLADCDSPLSNEHQCARWFRAARGQDEGVPARELTFKNAVKGSTLVLWLSWQDSLYTRVDRHIDACRPFVARNARCATEGRRGSRVLANGCDSDASGFAIHRGQIARTNTNPWSCQSARIVLARRALSAPSAPPSNSSEAHAASTLVSASRVCRQCFPRCLVGWTTRLSPCRQ